jgi:uncharacterized phage protein (TIGR01671 family)
MTREIKFRVWDKDAHEMVGVENLHFRDDVINRVSYDAAVDYSHDDGGRWSGDCILMQFTGLKDKNGKEIYEGDIIHITASELMDEGDRDLDVCATVSFVDGAFETDFHGALIRIARQGKFIVEVTGNIYEHPELLTLKP